MLNNFWYFFLKLDENYPLWAIQVKSKEKKSIYICETKQINCAVYIVIIFQFKLLFRNFIWQEEGHI